MKNVKRRFGLILAAVLICLFLNFPALDADSGDSIATPVQYTLAVDDNGVSLWAYEIDGNIYFKLRDLAMALSGTGKQFDIVWEGENKEVDLIPGHAYTPAGGELSKPEHVGNAAARYTNYSIRTLYGWGNILA